MILLLTLPPSKNAIHVRTKWGIALSHKARAWKKQAIAEMMRQIKPKELQEFYEWTEDGNDLYVDIKVCFPDKKRRDAHNVIEILCDALQDATGINDCYYLAGVRGRQINKDNPHVKVDIYKSCVDEFPGSPGKIQ